ncbi:MAG: hypothetical protein RR595_02845 [Lysinibacillus sp.]
MSYQLFIGISIAIMSLTAWITYYLGQKVSGKLTKYMPAFSFAVGMLFMFIKIQFAPFKANSFEHISTIIMLIVLALLFVIAVLEAAIVDILEKEKLIESISTFIKRAIHIVKKRINDNSILRKIRNG